MMSIRFTLRGCALCYATVQAIDMPSTDESVILIGGAERGTHARRTACTCPPRLTGVVLSRTADSKAAWIDKSLKQCAIACRPTTTAASARDAGRYVFASL